MRVTQAVSKVHTSSQKQPTVKKARQEWSAEQARSSGDHDRIKQFHELVRHETKLPTETDDLVTIAQRKGNNQPHGVDNHERKQLQVIRDKVEAAKQGKTTVHLMEKALEAQKRAGAKYEQLKEHHERLHKYAVCRCPRSGHLESLELVRANDAISSPLPLC